MYDFGGYATKNDLRCTDGVKIRKGAFSASNGTTVPLVWQHLHNGPENILGHAFLEEREDGMYAYGTFNNTEKAKIAKELVHNGDIKSLSIFANRVEKVRDNVTHGDLIEVSLVLAGANPGATIEFVNLEHADGTIDTLDDECIICTGLQIETENLEHADEVEEEDEDLETTDTLSHADSSDNVTLKSVFDSMNEDQKKFCYALADNLVKELGGGSVEHSKGGDKKMYDVFTGSRTDVQDQRKVLTHSQVAAIFEDAKKCGSFRTAVLKHAQTYGIENIDILFPDAKSVTPTPDFIKRDTEWVNTVINGARHTPISRIKSLTADITADEARARGYIKGRLKKDEVIKLAKRVTTPTTVYKKQKLDRDDIIDIVDFDVVAWLRAEMRLMLNEELARAILVGDGRDVSNEDKIDEEHIRPIWTDHELYTMRLTLESSATIEDNMEAIIRAMNDYEGKGTPALYTTRQNLTNMLLLKDKIGRRIYNNANDVADALGVSRIIDVPVMKGLTRTDEDAGKVNLFGIIVNMSDYTIGTNKGGQVSSFEDFDIDYNQYKYLLETRCSGTLIHPKTALAIETKVGSGL